jgi:CO/xanthine dehydrogenase Mo-binding subunit
MNEDREPDGHGGFNAVLRLGAQAALQSARGVTGDGRIEAAAIAHQPRSPMGAGMLPDGSVRLRIRTLAHDVERVRVAADGSVHVMTGIQNIGQGIETAYAQVTADALGCALSDVTVRTLLNQ